MSKWVGRAQNVLRQVLGKWWRWGLPIFTYPHCAATSGSAQWQQLQVQPSGGSSKPSASLLMPSPGTELLLHWAWRRSSGISGGSMPGSELSAEVAAAGCVKNGKPLAAASPMPAPMHSVLCPPTHFLGSPSGCPWGVVLVANWLHGVIPVVSWQRRLGGGELAASWPW